MALNFRSCSGEPNRLARFYHSGDTDDLDLVVRLFAGRDPHARIGAVGISLGGNVLLMSRSGDQFDPSPPSGCGSGSPS